MIKLDKEYSDYTDDTDDAYPAGKAVDATTEESIDGTPYLQKWMNNIHGAFTALWVKAFGSVDGMSGDPDSVAHSDVLLAAEKLIELPLTLHSDTRGANAHGATYEATSGQIVTRDQVGRAKVAAPVAPDDIARKEEVDAEATARTSADSGLQNQITTEAQTRANADSGLQNQISSEVSTRAAADIGLQNQLNSEVSTRAAADSGLQNQINVEAQTRANTDSGLSGRINSNDTELRNLKIYSTGEVNTGKKWIDGRDIFRMCAGGDSSESGHILFNIGYDNTVVFQALSLLQHGDCWRSDFQDDDRRERAFLLIDHGGECFLHMDGRGVAGYPYSVIVEYVKH